MGFKKHSGAGSNYISVMAGKIVVKASEGDEGAAARQNKDDVTVWEHLYDSYEGHITKAEIKASTNDKYPDQLVIEVTDKATGEKVNIAVSMTSKYSSKFFQVMKAIDLKRPVEFVPYHMEKEEKGKFNTGWNLYQGGTKPENKLMPTFDLGHKDPKTKKWVPGEVPEWTCEEKKVKGKMKTVWDNSDEIEFYTKHFNKWVEKNGLDAEDEDDKPAEDEDDEPKSKAKPGSKSKPAAKDEDDDDDY